MAATATPTRIRQNFDKLATAKEALRTIDGRSIPKAQRQHVWDLQVAAAKAVDDLAAYLVANGQ